MELNNSFFSSMIMKVYVHKSDGSMELHEYELKKKSYGAPWVRNSIIDLHYG